MAITLGVRGITAELSAAGMHFARLTYHPYEGELGCRHGPAAEAADELPPALPPVPPNGVATRVPNVHAECRAASLLESLLDADQLAEWRSTATFWVDTPRCKVRLGRRYDLRHIPPNGAERSLCVVADTDTYLPAGDEWATLLLWLRTDPDHFFRVAHPAPDLMPDTALRGRPCSTGGVEPDDLHDLMRTELDRLEDSFAAGVNPDIAVRSGHPGLDAALRGLGAGNVVLVTGPPGSAKTALAIGVAVRTAADLASNRGIDDPGNARVLLCAPQCDLQTLLARVLTHEGPLPLQNAMTLRMSEGDWQAYARAVSRVTGMPLQLHAGWDVGVGEWSQLVDDTDNTALAVIDDASTLATGLTETLDRARHFARTRRCPVLLAATTHTATDIPPEIIDRTDAVIVMEDSPRTGRFSPVATRTLRLLKNRIGPRCDIPAVLVEPWGRLLPVDTTARTRTPDRVGDGRQGFASG